MQNNKQYLELLKIRKEIIEKYYNVYNDFTIKKAIDIDEKKDITLDFVNCTICLSKNDLVNGIIGNNYVTIQPCLRNNHIELLADYNKTSNYLSYFTMLGGFYYISENDNLIDKYNMIVRRQYAFFRSLVNNSKIVLTIPIQYSNYLPISFETKKIILNNNDEILYSSVDDKNLKWTYGIEGIYGYGTRWEIENINKKIVNCGNDIILFKDNRPIGIDFGSGLETLVSLSNGFENLLYSNMICSDYIKEFCIGNSLNEKLIDCLLSVICCEYYKKIKNVRIKYLINNYLRIVSAISIINDISDDKIFDIMKEICKNLNIYDEEIIENSLIFIIKQKKYLYDISFNDDIKKKIKCYKKSNDRYEKKLMNIEVYALKNIMEVTKND